MTIKESENNSQNARQSEAEQENTGFASISKYIILSIILGIIAQGLFQRTDFGESINWLGSLGVLALLGMFITLYGKQFYRIIDTPYFAISSLLFLAAGTALGTFVSQNTTNEVFVQRYGESASRILRTLQLHDVFHSWWYIIIFLLLMISLLKISLKRELSWQNTGFHFAHLGPIIIFFGFAWDYYAGFRGLMQLIKGKETNHVWVYHRNTNRVRDSLKLDFNLHLDDFESQKFDPDHRIQVWQSYSPNPNPSEGLNTNTSRIITTLPLTVEKSWKVYNTDIRFKLKEFYPNFYFEYSYPPEKDTVEAKDPGILVEILTPHGSDIMRLSEDPTGRNIINDPILRTSFEFYWELTEDLSAAIIDGSPAALGNKNRIIFEGNSNRIYEIYEGNLLTKQLKRDTAYTIHGNDKSAYSIIYLYPDAAFLISGPATRNEKQENPVARLEVSREEWDEPNDAFIFPHQGNGNGQFLIPGTNYTLALESIKDQETKFWRSDLSILDKNGERLKTQSIKVNEPLLYKGYRFYQTDYDPNNPNYSGIGISYTPGLSVIYFGFIILVIGIFLLFYVRYQHSRSRSVQTI
jgi:hypothetical protein